MFCGIRVHLPTAFQSAGQDSDCPGSCFAGRLADSVKAETGNSILPVCASVRRSLLVREKTGEPVTLPVCPRRTAVQPFEKTRKIIFR